MKPVFFFSLFFSASLFCSANPVAGDISSPAHAPVVDSRSMTSVGHSLDASVASVIMGTTTRTFAFVADPGVQRPCPEGLSEAARTPIRPRVDTSGVPGNLSGMVDTLSSSGGSFTLGGSFRPIDEASLRAAVGDAIFRCNPQLPPFERNRDGYRDDFGRYHARGGWRHNRTGDAAPASAAVDGDRGTASVSTDSAGGTVIRDSSGASSFSSGSGASVPATIQAVMALANPQSSCDSVPVPISALDYVGMRLDLTSSGQQRNVYCVQASDDTQAHSACGGDTGGYSPINPGNPQYGITNDGDSGNTRRTNSAGYYFCVSKAPDENIKKELCDSAGSSLPGFRFKWFSIGGDTSRDGNCECREENAPDVDSSYSMNCSARDLNPRAVAAANAQAASASQPVNPVAPTQDNIQTFQACVNRYKQNAQDCKNNADQANRVCDPNNIHVDSGAGQAAGAAGSLASVYTQLNAGSGSQSSCFNAGLLSNAARLAAQQSSEQCSTGVSSCQSQCSSDQYDKFRNECAQKLGMTPDQLNAATTAEAQTFRTESPTIQQLFADGLTSCQQAAPKADTLNSMLTGVGNALQSSLRCACQLSSSATVATAATTAGATQGGCNAANIPNVQDCATNPALSGCQVYSELSVCTPGSSYDAALCRCQTNPSADGCANVATSGTLASMAGSAIASGATASAEGFTAPNLGSATAPQALDLSGGEDASGASLDATAKSGAPGSRQPYVSGGGGADGGGSGLAQGAAGGAATEADKDGIIGGLMNALRTGARSLGFGKDKANGNYRNAQSTSGANGSFKPRGLAGGRSGIGSRNMEIWTMMNRCVQAETCPSNSQQYILSP